MFFLLLLLISIKMFSMQSNCDRRSPFSMSISSSTQLESEDLCDVAMEKYRVDGVDIEKYVKPHLKRIIEGSQGSPLLPTNPSGLEVLRRVRSGDSSTVNERCIHDMVIRAMHEAFKNQEEIISQREEIIAQRERIIRERYSVKKTVAIAAITGALSTICTTICATLITIHSK